MLGLGLSTVAGVVGASAGTMRLGVSCAMALFPWQGGLVVCRSADAPTNPFFLEKLIVFLHKCLLKVSSLFNECF